MTPPANQAFDDDETDSFDREVDQRLARVWRDSRLGPTVERLRRYVLQEGDQKIDVANYRVLHAMVELGPVTMRELSIAVGSAQSSVSRTVARLEDMGAVERETHPSDQRSVVVSVTEAGRETHGYFSDRAFEIYQEIFAVFSAEEREALSGMLERLLKSANATLSDGHGIP